MFYEEASFSQYEKISMEYRPKFLEWAYFKFDLDKSRYLFTELKNLQPTCKELYMKMIQIESLHYLDYDIKSLNFIRTLFSETCNIFGNNDIG